MYFDRGIINLPLWDHTEQLPLKPSVLHLFPQPLAAGGPAETNVPSLDFAECHIVGILRVWPFQTCFFNLVICIQVPPCLFMAW